MDFSDYLFRAHMVGKIIDVPKALTPNQKETLEDYKERFNGKGRALTENQEKVYFSLQNKYYESLKYKLSDSTKRTLSELVFAEKYKRYKDINSPKISKGLECEKMSRDLLSDVTGLFLTPSVERKYNKWVTGAIDVEPDNVIIDIKSTWSWESYSKIIESSANEIYLRQGDSYMDLWGIDEFLLCHTLVDTPNYLVEGEIKRYDYKNNILDIEGNVREENIVDIKRIVTNHIFTFEALNSFVEYSGIVEMDWFDDFVEIPKQDRVHMIPHSYNKERIEQRNECISLAREYMNTVKPINNFKPELLTNVKVA